LTSYVLISNGIVESQHGQVDPPGFVGPPTPPPSDEETYVLLTEPIDWAGRPSAGSQLHIIDGTFEWVEAVAIEDYRSQAFDRIDTAAEALRMAVITKLTQTSEYERAERHAREYRADGYPEGDEAYVPPGVASWAQAKWREGWTARQAADDILAIAESWYAILDDIRALRLANKEDIRAASSAAEIAAICDDMEGDMRAIAQQLQLTLTN